MGQAIHDYALRMGLTPPAETLDGVQPDHWHISDGANKAILENLPRGNKLPPLLTDFLDITTVLCADHIFLTMQSLVQGYRTMQFFQKLLG